MLLAYFSIQDQEDISQSRRSKELEIDFARAETGEQSMERLKAKMQRTEEIRRNILKIDKK